MNDYEIHLVEEVRAERMTRAELIRRASVAGLSLSATATLLAACGGKKSSAPTTTSGTGKIQRGGVAKFSSAVPTADVDPVTMFDQGAIFTAQLGGLYLAESTPDYRLTPGVATKWEQGASAKEWTFHLRKDVTFADGKPLTADDVVYTFDTLTSPKVNSAALSALGGILSFENTEKVDASTVRFHLDRPFVDFPYQVAAFNYNAILLPRGYKVGEFIKGRPLGGSFHLQRYAYKRFAKFTKNPGYYRTGLPYMNGVEMRYFSDTSSEVLALEAGEIDVFPQTPYQGSQALFRDSKVEVLQAPSSEYRSVHMRVDTKPFDDKRVRQAIAYCLDRPAIVKALLGGRGDVANDHSWAPVYSTAPSEAELPQRKQDYAKAKKLLADAGHANGVDVTLIVEQFLEVPQYAVLIREQCKPAGINVKLHSEDQTTFYGSGKSQPWLVVPFAIVDWGGRGTVSQLVLPAYTSKGIWNSAHWRNKEFDRAMAAFDGESDEQKRKALALKAARIQHDEVPALISYWIRGQRTLRKWVHNLPAGPVDRMAVDDLWLSAKS